MAEDERAYRRQRRVYRVLYEPARLLMKGLLNYEFEPAPQGAGPCLILSNHVTDFDPILVGLSFPEHMYYVAGENVMRMGLLSKVVTRYASVIQRIKGTTDAEAALQILRTLKKGGTFALHDIFSKSKYGDMQAFVSQLKDRGYRKVELIDTTDGKYMTRFEAGWMALSGSALLTGIK